MSDKEEMSSDGNLNVTLTLRLLMHGKVLQIQVIWLFSTKWTANAMLKLLHSTLHRSS